MGNSEPIKDALIVGAGVIGLSLAWELARRGMQVSVIDAGPLARGASWAGAGILPPAANVDSPDPYEQLRTLSHKMHAEWSARLLTDTGIDNEYRRCGGLYLARSQAEAATLAGNQYWWEDQAIEFRKVDIREAVELEPALHTVSEELQAAWVLPDECQIRNPRHLSALQEACQSLGVEFTENVTFDSLKREDGAGESAGNVAVSISDGRTILARRVCICSGAWARQHLEKWSIKSGIMPVRGQMILYECPTPLINHVVNEGHRYLVARADGHLLAGSVEEEVGYECETTEEGIGQIKDWAESILPQLKEVPIKRTWAGLRPGSFDTLPYLGELPGYEDVFLAAGHFRSGLHLSCATAVVMADLMLGESPKIDLTPFRISRG